VTSTGDLVEDLTWNFFLETGARQNKLRVYEMVDHPAAKALTGYLLVRGGVHQVAYARALEHLTGADMSKLFPAPRIPTEKIPECQPQSSRGRTPSCTASRLATTRRSPRYSTARTRRRASR
jgi:Mn-containing catalase